MTSPYERPEYLAQIAGIREMPDDDLRRLVVADWLEENGEPERADFIRVQCEIVKGRRPDLWMWSREREILETHHDTLFPPPVGYSRTTVTLSGPQDGSLAWIASGAAGRLINFTVDRGFIASVRAPLAVLIGGECWRCGGDGRAHGADRPFEWSDNVDYGKCVVCHGTGRTPGVLRELLRREPLGPEGIKVTDMPIFPSGGNSTYYVGGLGRLPQEYWRQLDSLPTKSAASLALSRAVYQLCSPKSEVKS